MSATPFLLQAVIGLMIGASMAAAFKQLVVRMILVAAILLIVSARAYYAATVDLQPFLDSFLVDLEGVLVWLTERPMLAGGTTTGYAGWRWILSRRQAPAPQA